MLIRRIARCAALAALAVVLASAGHSYSGGLTSPVASGIDGTGFWITEGTTIRWNVTPITGGYNYWYRLEVPRADVSHMILETSTNFTLQDMSNLVFTQGTYQTLTTPQLWGPGPGNPSIPGNVYGIKFDGTTGTTLEFNFDSARVPVWGDFYAKCGAVGGTQNTAWNSGFAAADPLGPATDGSDNYHILVPDTAVVPEPGSLMLAAVGLTGLASTKRLFRR